MATVRATTRPAIAVAASLAALALTPVDAGPLHPRHEVEITTWADHYVVKGRVVDDLDVLERVVDALRSRIVKLQACEGMADRAQRAAAHRFRALSLELRLLEPHDPACQRMAARNSPR